MTSVEHVKSRESAKMERSKYVTKGRPAASLTLVGCDIASITATLVVRVQQKEILLATTKMTETTETPMKGA
jgi:hypothetical protein